MFALQSHTNHTDYYNLNANCSDNNNKPLNEEPHLLSIRLGREGARMPACWDNMQELTPATFKYDKLSQRDGIEKVRAKQTGAAASAAPWLQWRH